MPINAALFIVLPFLACFTPENAQRTESIAASVIHNVCTLPQEPSFSVAGTKNLLNKFVHSYAKIVPHSCFFLLIRIKQGKNKVSKGKNKTTYAYCITVVILCIYIFYICSRFLYKENIIKKQGSRTLPRRLVLDFLFELMYKQTVTCFVFTLKKAKHRHAEHFYLSARMSSIIFSGGKKCKIHKACASLCLRRCIGLFPRKQYFILLFIRQVLWYNIPR